MTSEKFYSDLRPYPNMQDILQAAAYRSLPEDWHVVICDIRHSTQATESGLYKHVTLVGAASIIAVLNIDRSIELPFAFGGDGSILCIPAKMVSAVQEALLATKLMVLKKYKLAR